jgi:hypothetical protein
MENLYVKNLLKNSYDMKKNPNDFQNYKVDQSLSGKRVQVYHDDDTNKTVVAHRGTKGSQDMITDLLFGSVGYRTNRFKHGKKIQKEAEKKYADSDITTLGHSLGAAIAKESAKDRVIAVNRPVGISEVFSGKKDNIIDVRTKYDPISMFENISQKNGKEINLKSKNGLNLLEEHSHRNLNNIDDNVIIGGRLRKFRGFPIRKRK